MGIKLFGADVISLEQKFMSFCHMAAANFLDS